MSEHKTKISKHALQLMLFDLLWLIVVSLAILWAYPSGDRRLDQAGIVAHFIIAALSIFVTRYVCGMYSYVWRYGGNYLNIRLMFTDMAAGIAYYILQLLLPVQKTEFLRVVALIALNLLGAVGMRQIYQFLYDAKSQDMVIAQIGRVIIGKLTGIRIEPKSDYEAEKTGRKINIAIVGAGRVGVSLAEDLASNPHAFYAPKFFVDIDKNKIGRSINGIPVYSESEADSVIFNRYGIQEVVFALPDVTAERKRELYDHYHTTGCRLKTYDYPTTQEIGRGKRAMREFGIEELLFRVQADFLNDETKAYYRDKVVLISGGGGSIGSELARQIAKMSPRKLVILDVYENCAYDIQQELRIKYGAKLDLAVEIITITDKGELDRAFAAHHPDIVLHAAAHKHVPLMEHNCCEAVKNNVFGTKNIVEMAEKHGCKKFIMISTDKAVNPTNIMGATKRMCEMIVLSHQGNMACSATRFGNVLGSNGSVIPLFKRQIQNGGPVTLTDKRIIRYFMTIPEASQLVLTSGAMARHGELYVLDMGKPVKIQELAENMIRLSGYEPYKDIDIIETGLRPGEKLYEELLVKSEELDKTDNEMIFIERDKPLDADQIKEKLQILAQAVATDDNETCRKAMKQVVPTFKDPKVVNKNADKAEEVQQAG